MNEPDWLIERFEAHSSHLRAVAYGMLGSLAEADAALAEARLRLAQAEAGDADNLRAWLTTVVGRVSLTRLSARPPRRDGASRDDRPDAAAMTQGPAPYGQDVLLGDSVGLALLVALDALTPPERVAFVMHEIFAVPFHHIATVLDRTPSEARHLVGRARRRIRGGFAGHTSAGDRV